MPVIPAAPSPKANTAKEEERIHCLEARSVEVLSAWNFKGLPLAAWLSELESLSAAELGLSPAGFSAGEAPVAGSGRVGKAFAGGWASRGRLSESRIPAELVPPSCELACSREEEEGWGLRAAPVCPAVGFEVGLVPGFEVPP